MGLYLFPFEKICSNVPIAYGLWNKVSFWLINGRGAGGGTCTYTMVGRSLNERMLIGSLNLLMVIMVID